MVGEATFIQPTGCYNLDDGTSVDTECTDDEVTINEYDDVDCGGTMTNSTTYGGDDCEWGTIYSVDSCGGSGGGGGDGSSNAIKISFVAVFALIAIIQLLQ